MIQTEIAENSVERDRQQLIAEMDADSGADWARDFLPGTAGCHELLDRTSLFADMIERHLASHPACVANPDWFQLAEQAAAALHELYQRIGAEHLTADK